MPAAAPLSAKKTTVRLKAARPNCTVTTAEVV
jgi:hypothetical protein